MNTHVQPLAPARWRWAWRLAAALSLLFGLYYLIAGGYLATLGGSLYFGAAGVAMLVAGGLLWRGARTGAGCTR